MKKRVIAYLHSHWDREWYREFEIFRMRLLRVFDEVIEALEKDLIPSFYFDGQVVALLDYLEMRPQNEQRIRELIKSKKLFIGPFYCLIDEFLTNATLFEKNLEYGLKIARDFGCENFTGYLPDTFGHSASVIKHLKSFNINEAFVWRGCGDLPSEFVWSDDEGNKIQATNLLRGYFMDIFTADVGIESKIEFLKKNLDLIAEKSGDVLLLPVGGDHLGIPIDIKEQIQLINDKLEDYSIELGSIFDYINLVKDSASVVHKGELRDNSKTFTLEGAYSSRADIKRLNAISMHKLERAERLADFYKEDYASHLDYAYKLLLKNQAHDGICGCSTDDTHYENILRYKKIIQITDNIESEIKFKKSLYDKVVNLSHIPFTGVIERTRYEITRDDIVYKEEQGFRDNLLADIKRVPITEDYSSIYTVLEYVKDVQYGENIFSASTPNLVVNATETMLSTNVSIKVTDKIIFSRNGKEYSLFIRDFQDFGDSYNRGVVENDEGNILKIESCRNIFNSPLRSVLEVKFQSDIRLEVSLDADSNAPKFNFTINNKNKNHHLLLCVELENPIFKVYSEDMNKIICREFDSSYDIRQNLPKTRGLESNTNTAPFQRFVWADGIGIVTKGISQYEVSGKELRLSLLRATGVISNPLNSTRTTPAGPPLETPEAQLITTINQELTIFSSEIDNISEFLPNLFSLIV